MAIVLNSYISNASSAAVCRFTRFRNLVLSGRRLLMMLCYAFFKAFGQFSVVFQLETSEEGMLNL